MADGGAAPTTENGEQDPLVGRTFNERYKVLALIAKGGMGKVYRAQQSPLGRICALKVLNASASGDQDAEFHRRFFLEASMTAKLRHPNTVMVFDYGRTEDNIYYMAMEYLEGQTLQHALREDGPFSEQRAAHIVQQICRSLREAHAAGVIHRDLKPANIYLLEHGDEPDFVKVLDFGLVKKVAGNHGEDQTLAGLRMGSPKYMAPEQVSGDPVDPGTDIYALGVILYEMVAGKVPFDHPSTVALLMAHMKDRPPPLHEVNPGAKVSAALEETIARAMAKSPHDRFRSMDEVLAALKRLGPEATAESSASLTADAAGPASVAAQELDLAGSSRSPRRKSWLWVLAAVVGPLALAGGIVRLALRSGDGSEALVPRAATTQPAAPSASMPSAAAGPVVGAGSTPPAEVDPTPPVAVSAEAPTAPRATALPPSAATRKVRAPTTPRPPAAKAAATAVGKPSAACNPNFYYDADGNKHFKPECFR